MNSKTIRRKRKPYKKSNAIRRKRKTYKMTGGVPQYMPAIILNQIEQNLKEKIDNQGRRLISDDYIRYIMALCRECIANGLSIYYDHGYLGRSGASQNEHSIYISTSGGPVMNPVHMHLFDFGTNGSFMTSQLTQGGHSNRERHDISSDFVRRGIVAKCLRLLPPAGAAAAAAPAAAAPPASPGYGFGASPAASPGYGFGPAQGGFEAARQAAAWQAAQQQAAQQEAARQAAAWQAAQQQAAQQEAARQAAAWQGAQQAARQAAAAPGYGFGSAQPAFGSAQPAFGSAQPAFGSAQPAFGPAQPAFGPAQPWFGPAQPDFSWSATVSSLRPQTQAERDAQRAQYLHRESLKPPPKPFGRP